MCGIAGIRSFKGTPIQEHEIYVLLQSLEHRGNQASGIALMTPKGIQIHKAPDPAWNFCGAPETKEFLAANLEGATMALLHTRAATIGNPEENKNNHPMFAGRTAVVHNGGIQNHEAIFGQLKAERSCETDSDVFRAIFDTEGFGLPAVRTMNRCIGSAAIAAFTNDNPNLLVLARSGSPLVYGFSKQEEKLWWASELQAIQKAVRPWETFHGIFGRKFRSDMAYAAMPDDTAWLLDGDGQQKAEFKTCSWYRQPIYNMRESYQRNKDRFQGSKKPAVVTKPAIDKTKYKQKWAECPNPQCKKANFIGIDDKFNEYTCWSCKQSLTSLDSLLDSELGFVDMK